ncbi:hypothetical protein [Lewinella sp. W8]|uniref:hypothetical protein n=1 Tax=Lewinella sp. W8 TaxID=2528208 RepID=UPI00106774BA|nr:hypothetical protein [Lewinella sp. W8]MTB53939.1 hypothetical protein [Lewinella sp. W8]
MDRVEIKELVSKLERVAASIDVKEIAAEKPEQFAKAAYHKQQAVTHLLKYVSTVIEDNGDDIEQGIDWKKLLRLILKVVDIILDLLDFYP